MAKKIGVKILMLTIMWCLLVEVYHFMTLQDSTGMKAFNVNNTVDNPSRKQGILSRYINKYEPLVDSKCSQEFGIQMLLAWRRNRKKLCKGKSQITCLRREPYSVPRYLCDIHEAEIRMLEPFYKAAHTNLSAFSHVSLKKGLVKAECDAAEYDAFPKTEWDEKVNFFLGEIHVDKNLECVYYVNATVFWLHRWDAVNVYHAMEDVITTFESLAVMNIDPRDVQIVIYDGFVMNNANSQLWALLFGHGVRVIRTDPYPAGTCFRKSVISMQGLVSHLTHNDGIYVNTTCASPIMKGMRDWILHTLEIEGEAHMPQRSRQDKEYKIAIIFRAVKDLRIYNTRIITNEVNLTDYIRSQLPRNWKLMIFRPEIFQSVREQIKYASSLDILVGAHGAALTYSIYLPKHAHVIEIFMGDRFPVNRHYYHMCKWLKLAYHPTEYQEQEVDILHIWSLVNKAIETIRSN